MRAGRSVLYLPALELQFVRLFLGIFCCSDVILQANDEKNITSGQSVVCLWSSFFPTKSRDAEVDPLTKLMKTMPRFSMRLQMFRMSPYGL